MFNRKGHIRHCTEKYFPVKKNLSVSVEGKKIDSINFFKKLETRVNLKYFPKAFAIK